MHQVQVVAVAEAFEVVREVLAGQLQSQCREALDAEEGVVQVGPAGAVHEAAAGGGLAAKEGVKAAAPLRGQRRPAGGGQHFLADVHGSARGVRTR